MMTILILSIIWIIVDLIAIVTFAFLAILSLSIYKKLDMTDYILLSHGFIFISIGFTVDMLSFIIGSYGYFKGVFVNPEEFINANKYMIMLTLLSFLAGFVILIISVRRFSVLSLLPCSLVLLNMVLASLLLVLAGFIIYFEKNTVLRKPTKLSFLFLALAHLSVMFPGISGLELLFVLLLFRAIAISLISYAIVRGAFYHE